ncbi:MAG: M20 family metallopeptidase [Candidatus Lokiarchaeota archaeon]|nr:M20 family metallopeptidase [Candidatus Lokiarchaeota archaeon]
MKLVNSQKDRLVYLLQKLVQIPTENPPGKTEEVVEFLITEVFKEEEGFHNEVVTHLKNKIKLHNLITRIGSGKKKIILSGHFDVVPVGDSSKWDYPPFSARIIDDKLYGRGSADMKGGIVSLIGTLKSLSREKKFLENYELIFLGTADEEAGMSGSLTLTNKGIINDAILLIIGEPTGLNIGIAEKGVLWVKLKLYGRAAHGSMPEEGINAIEGALKIIPKLGKCLRDFNNPVLGSSSINIGKIKGGNKINVVPDYTELEIDFRIIPEQNVGDLINSLKMIDPEPFKMDIEILNNLPALQSDSKHPFIRNLKRISNMELIGLPYATDLAKFITTDNPVPFVIYGPGNPNDVHKINESISLNQIFLATESLTDALLETYL